MTAEKSFSRHDLNSIRETVLEIWHKIPVPEGRILAPGADLNEAHAEAFLGKRFDEVDQEPAIVWNRSPLIYFTPEARYYYLGTYLLMTLDCGEDAGKWSLGAGHGVETLRRLLGNPGEMSKVQATDPRLVDLLTWFDSCEVM
jgi:hypothetical protein